jgi:hypothetical protein
MAKQKFAVTGDQYRTIHRKVRDMFRQLDHKNGSTLDPKLMMEALQNIVNGKFDQPETKIIVSSHSLIMQTPYFRLIPGVQNLRLGSSDGRTIAIAKDVFKSGISSDFVNFGLNNPGPAILRARFSGYKLIADATFKQMFPSFGVDLEKLWSRQGQVLDICVFYAKHLCQNGNANFFIIKKDETKPAAEDNLFVVYVYLRSDGLHAYVYRFSYGYIWGGERGDRFFCPQLLAA